MTDVPDIIALRNLTSIADSGGFRRAADNLHLSQSAVSQHLRRLERACGRPLVQRTGRGAQFTPDGELLVAEARKILAAHDDALERVRVSPHPELAFTIGSTEHAADVLLPAITARLKASFPEHSITFRIDRGKQLNERLDQGALDASVSIGDVRGRSARPAGASVVCEAGHLAGVVNAARAGVGVALLAHLRAAPQGLAHQPDLPPVAPEPLHVRGRSHAPAGLVTAIAEAAAELLSPANSAAVAG